MVAAPQGGPRLGSIAVGLACHHSVLCKRPYGPRMLAENDGNVLSGQSAQVAVLGVNDERGQK